MTEEKIFNLDAEIAVIGALLINNDFFLDTVETLRSDYFYEPCNKAIYSWIEEGYSKGQKLDGITIANKIKKSELFKDFNANEYLSILIENAADEQSIKDYSIFVAEMWKRRAAHQIAIELGNNLINNLDDKPDLIVTDAQEQLLMLDDVGVGKNPQNVGDICAEFLQNLPNMQKNAIKTGIESLDNAIGYFGGGMLWVMGGASSMGKTTILTNIASNVSEQIDESGRKRNVLMISNEMMNFQYAPRMLSSYCDSVVPYQDILDNKLEHWQRTELKQALLRLKDLNVNFIAKRGMSALEIISIIRKEQYNLKRKGEDLSLVIVDLLDEIDHPKAETEAARIGKSVKLLYDAAGNFNLPIILGAQVNRRVNEREDKRPQMADLSGSSQSEKSADIVTFAYREYYYLQRQSVSDVDFAEHQAKLETAKNQIEIVCRKNRQGRIGEAILRCNMPCNKIYN